MGMHYEGAARDESALQKPVEKKFFESVEEQTERVSVKCACVIAVTSSLRALHLFPVCSKGRR